MTPKGAEDSPADSRNDLEGVESAAIRDGLGTSARELGAPAETHGNPPEDDGRPLRTPAQNQERPRPGRVNGMGTILSPTELARLRRMVKRPRSRKQFYRARALLALDEGHPIDTVARMFKVGPERVELWADSFAKRRLAFLDEPRGPGARTRWEGPPEDEDDDSRDDGS